MDKESVKLALRQHYPAGYRYLGCLVISSRVRPTVLLAARAPQRKLIALRATVPSSGTGPSTRSCPTAASPVLTRGYSPCDPIRGIPLRATTCRRSRALNCLRGSGGSFFSTPFVLSSTLTAARSTVHTRARARVYTHIHAYGRTRPITRARANDPFSSSLSLQTSLSGLSLFLSRTLRPPSLPLPPTTTTLSPTPSLSRSTLLRSFPSSASRRLSLGTTRPAQRVARW